MIGVDNLKIYWQRMNFSKLAVSFTILITLAVLSSVNVALAQEPITDINGPAYVEGELLVKFKPGFSVQSTDQKVAEVNGTAVETIPAINTVKVEVPAGQEQSAVAQLQARSDVEYVELNYIAYALDTPNDPSYVSQWGLPKIDMPNAWQIGEGSSDVVVAVIDTGIDLDHPDLSCTVPDGEPKLTNGWDYANGDSSADDDHSHGTHVAGIISACTDNDVGIAGVAPNVRLMPVKVLDSGGSGSYSDVANGIIYATNNGADIINLSLGGSAGNSTLASAVQYANNNGVLVIAASGNAGASSIYYPAAYSEAMAVGATDSTDYRAYYSNYGNGLDVVAPGSSIYSTVPGSYAYKSGTSMATPHVAGLAALIWSLDPALSNTEVRQIIQSTTDDKGSAGYDIYYGHGRINAYAALERFVTITLQESGGQPLLDAIGFLTDDETDPLPASKTIQITTLNQDVITWTAAISPEVPWLEINSEVEGLVSASTSADFTLVATRPTTYGTHTTNVVVTGTTSSGLLVGPTTQEVKINYVEELQRLYFPIIFK